MFSMVEIISPFIHMTFAQAVIPLQVSIEVELLVTARDTEVVTVGRDTLLDTFQGVWICS